jgi:hypothetical protein
MVRLSLSFTVSSFGSFARHCEERSDEAIHSLAGG